MGNNCNHHIWRRSLNTSEHVEVEDAVESNVKQFFSPEEEGKGFDLHDDSFLHFCMRILFAFYFLCWFDFDFALLTLNIVGGLSFA